MDVLSENDCRALLDCVFALNGAPDLDSLAQRMVELLPNLVCSDLTAYNEVNPRRNRMKVVSSDPSVCKPDFARVFLEYQHEHPVLQHFRRTRDGAAKAISDFLSPEQFEDTAIFNEAYRPLGCRDQMAVTVGSSKSVVVAMAFNRDRRGFSPRDRLMLNLIRPHLEQAYIRTALLTDLRKQHNRLDGALQALPDGVVILRANDRIAWASKRAMQCLNRYFAHLVGNSTLPETLRRWLAPAQARAAGTIPPPLQPITVQKAARTLIIRRLRDQTAGRDILLFTEKASEPSAAPLRALGLTHRETEVLLWLAKGKTNVQIAQVLGSKPRTVQKHAENIFRKLNVQTRAAAASRATQLLMHGEL